MFTADDIKPKLRKELEPLERALRERKVGCSSRKRWLASGRYLPDGSENPEFDSSKWLDANLAEALNRFGVFKGQEEEVQKRTAVVARKAPAPKKQKRA